MNLKAHLLLNDDEGRPQSLAFEYNLEAGFPLFVTGPARATALDVVLGRRRPEAGALTFDALIWFQGNGQQVLEVRKRPLATLPLEADLDPARTVGWHVRDALSRWPQRSRNQRAFELLDRVALGDREKVRFRDLSPLDVRRLQLALAVAMTPPLLLVEDLCDGLRRNDQRRLMWDLRHLVREEGIPALVGLSIPEGLLRPGDRVRETAFQPLRRLRTEAIA